MSANKVSAEGRFIIASVFVKTSAHRLPLACGISHYLRIPNAKGEHERQNAGKHKDVPEAGDFHF